MALAVAGRTASTRHRSERRRQRHSLASMEKVRAAATVSWQAAVEFAAEAFAATGVPEADARKAGEAIADADLHGTVTHGLKNLRNYVSGLLDGKINPRPSMREVGGPKSARIMTADNGLGMVAG